MAKKSRGMKSQIAAFRNRKFQIAMLFAWISNRSVSAFSKSRRFRDAKVGNFGGAVVVCSAAEGNICSGSYCKWFLSSTALCGSWDELCSPYDQKNPRVRKCFLSAILGLEMAAPILWAPGKCVLSAGKTIFLQNSAV